MTESIAVAGAPAGEEITDEAPRRRRRWRWLDRDVSCTASSATLAPATALSRTLPAISLARSSAAARRLRASPTFSPATSAVAAINARASSASVPDVIAGCLCLFVHIFCVFGLFVFFNGKFSASARWAASGELATCKIEFLPPNGLATDSLASGSGIHLPSTTRQYS